MARMFFELWSVSNKIALLPSSAPVPDDTWTQSKRAAPGRNYAATEKEMADNFTVKELLNHTFYRASINRQLCLCVCLWTLPLLQLSTFHSNERTALKTII